MLSLLSLDGGVKVLFNPGDFFGGGVNVRFRGLVEEVGELEPDNVSAPFALALALATSSKTLPEPKGELLAGGSLCFFER